MDLPKKKKNQHQTQKPKIKAPKHTTFLLSKVLGDKGEVLLFFFYVKLKWIRVDFLAVSWVHCFRNNRAIPG